MPRSKNKVKPKLEIQAPGAVDLHFHGAFGVDLMVAGEAELDRLSRELGKRGVAAFLPTTLSATPEALLQTVSRLGSWIRRGHHPGAVPLGIHLEGPFLNPASVGAHPPPVIRAATLGELRELWQASGRTLKILTIAPEAQDPGELRRVIRWAKSKKVILSLGHSRATRAEAEKALQAGFTGVTHAWNAMGFHHREPGLLGAALGRPDTHVELIIDGLHVDPTLVSWTRRLHPDGVCFVSDCAPAAGLPAGSRCSFGALSIRIENGACRVEPSGTLAGGGRLLSETFLSWVREESRRTGKPLVRVFREAHRHIHADPLRALGVRARSLKTDPFRWRSG